MLFVFFILIFVLVFYVNPIACLSASFQYDCYANYIVWASLGPIQLNELIVNLRCK